MYFPPFVEQDSQPKEAKGKDAMLNAEAEAVARELPSAPTSNPAEAGHVDKKQKHDRH